MGIFDSIKNALGGDDDDGGIKGPSMLLREAGIDPTGLDFSFGNDGAVTVSGHVADEATRARVEEIIGGIAQVSSVTNNLVVGAPPAAEPEAPEPAPAGEPESNEAATSAGSEVTSGVTPDEAAPEAATDVASDAASNPATEASAEGGKTYTVQSGDSLWKIAEAHLGSGARYQEIFEANRDILDNPDLIRPGQVLKIP